MTHIELQQIQKTYPRQAHPAAAGINLRVASGELLALLGASGSGKSTLLKLIAGVEQADHGAICFDGQPIDHLPAHKRGAVLMFQRAYLFPFLSVAENIAFGLTIQRVAPAVRERAVVRMLDLVELPGIAHKRPAQLSGGEQQRVALARALVIQPRVLLLDEPFSSLDAMVRQTLQVAVRRIQRELGITTILVTHDRSEALSMADQVALIDQGRLLACAPPQPLFQRPPTRRAAQLLGVSTFLSGSVVAGHLSTIFGNLPLSPNAPQGNATYAIRPDHIRLACTASPDSFPARLLSQTFRGEHYEYQVELGTTRLRITHPHPLTPSPDGCVHVAFPPEHLFAVVEDSEC
jgi:ABC-type Fe3+/spermidine/putrescine transport system ATPase subunit